MSDVWGLALSLLLEIRWILKEGGILETENWIVTGLNAMYYFTAGGWTSA